MTPPEVSGKRSNESYTMGERVSTCVTVLAYIRRGWSPLPIPHRKKGPTLKGWPDLRIGETDAPRYFNGRATNVGVLLGTPSGGLVDVDLDHQRAVELADDYLPATSAMFGRKGKPRSHRLYVVADGATTTRKWHAPDKAMIVELRSDGRQTVFPPSTHPSGEAIEWVTDGEPATVARGELENAVDNLAREVISEIAPAGTTPNTPGEPTPRPTPAAATDAVERCRRYIEKLPDAVAGQAGHDATFRMACECFRFGLNDADAATVAAWFNAEKYRPPWSDADLRHKMDSARMRVLADAEFDTRLIDNRKPKATPRRTGATDVALTPPLKYESFPTDALPEPLRLFVVSGAKAIGCDASYVVLPLLALVAAAIGNARRINLKGGWESWSEPSILWTAIVGESGSLKTPAMRLAMHHIRTLQNTAFRRYAEERAEYDSALLQYEKDLTGWKKGKSGGDPPEKPTPPTAERFVVCDATVEGLAAVLLENSKGVLLARDELAGWVGSFDRYAIGRGGDESNWISMHSGESLTIDRKTGTRIIHIPRASVSITGGIQPGILRRVMRAKHHESGLLGRLLFAMPPRRAKRWTEAEVSPSTAAAMGRVFDGLHSLQPDWDHNGEPTPHVVHLSADAKRRWVRFVGEHGREHVELTGDLAAAWSKLEGGAARLALIFHYARAVFDDPTLADVDAVDTQSIEAGIALSRWFGREARRVYGVLSESDEDRDIRQLVAWIARRGEAVTARDLTRNLSRFGNTDDARAVLDSLVDAGLARRVDQHPGKTGGHPTVRYELTDVTDTDETPAGDPVAGGSVGVGTVGTPQNADCVGGDNGHPLATVQPCEDSEVAPIDDGPPASYYDDRAPTEAEDDGDEWGTI